MKNRAVSTYKSLHQGCLPAKQVENTNRLIRQYIPKESDFTNITHGFLSPNQVSSKSTGWMQGYSCKPAFCNR